MNNNGFKSDLVNSKKKFNTVATYTITPSNDNCTVYISYFGEEEVDGLRVDMGLGNKFIMIRETENHYVVMGRADEEIPLPKEDCKKIPWFI